MISATLTSIITYGSEVWTNTGMIELRLRNFKNKIWRILFGSKLNSRV